MNGTPATECYNCQNPTTDFAARQGFAVINVLSGRFGMNFVERMTDESDVDTVHCRPSVEQTTSDGEVAYCAGCTLQLIAGGLGVPPPA